MKILIGLSDNLKRNPLWTDIWEQLAENLGEFKFEIIKPDSKIKPWLTVDLDNGPFILSLRASGINLAASLKSFQESGQLEFYFRSLLLTFLMKGMKKYVVKRAVFEVAVDQEIQEEYKSEVATYLAQAKLKVVPDTGKVEIIRESDTSIVIICINEEVDQQLTFFYNKRHDEGWKFHQIQ